MVSIVSYLYNMFEGSLDALAAHIAGNGLPRTPETLEEAIARDWTLVDPFIATLDWHEQDVLLVQARRRLPEPGPALVARLFEAPPLDIEPYDFGFWGSLTAAELAELRRLLEAAVGAEADRLAVVMSSPDLPTPDEPLTEDGTAGLAGVLVGIRPVTVGRDVVLRCG